LVKELILIGELNFPYWEGEAPAEPSDWLGGSLALPTLDGKK